MSVCSYTGVILDAESRQTLKRHFRSIVPSGWAWVAHHMTICLGSLSGEQREKLLGTVQKLIVHDIGISEYAIAVSVSGCESNNTIAHITLAINKLNGGKAKDSNLITHWENVTVTEPLYGIVAEIPHPNNKKDVSKIVDFKELPFIDEISNNKGNIYIVGGTLRDFYLDKPSKDLDLVISGIEINHLKSILSKYGRVEVVGESFGVIKFTNHITGETIDVALPRTETPNGLGSHRGFNVNADPNISIEKDLYRRDFTINSIAKDMCGNVIDPFGGVNDIKNKIIRVTNPDAFGDDPLRMMRAIQFSARFGFQIDSQTRELIQKNATKIKKEPWERILVEFEKIVNKGQPIIGAKLLVETGLFEQIFDNQFIGSLKPFGFIKHLSEFIYWLIEGFVSTPSKYFKDVMKGDIKTTNEIKALELVMRKPVRTDLESKWMVFNINKIAFTMLDSHFVNIELGELINDFKLKKYPISYKELAINGTDLEKIGLKNEKIGLGLKTTMDAVYSDIIPNEKDDLLNNIKNIYLI